MRSISLTLLFVGSVAGAQDLPQSRSMQGDQVLSGEEQEYLPGDQVIQRLDETPGLRKRVQESAEAFQRIREEAAARVVNMKPPEGESNSQPADEDESKSEIREKPAPKAPNKQQKQPGKRFYDRSDGVRIFSRGLNRQRKGRDYYSLPSTSFAMATLMHGIEGTASPDDLVAELDYAWMGPNGSVVEMTGCRLWINVRANYSTTRLNGHSESMTCRAPNGDTFDIAIEAKVIDGASEYAGVEGTLVPHGKALASALSFLQNGVEEWGKATASSQVSTSVASSGEGAPVKSSNVDGDKYRYIAGRSVSASTAEFLDWWINFYKGLTPTIAVAPGKKIYLIVKKTVKVPKIFFGKTIDAKTLSLIDGMNSGKASKIANTGTHAFDQLEKDGGNHE